MIDITFDNPMYLWYLLSIPLLVYTHFYLLKHTRQKAMKFANFDAIKRVTGEKLITKNWIVLIIRLSIISCIILAVAGTTVWYDGEVSQNDFVIAIDTSASMTAQDINPTRLEAAKAYSADMVKSLKTKSNFALLSFAGTTFIETNLIDNKDTIVKTIETLEPSQTGGTDIPGALITGTNMLLASPKGKTIVIITDGSNTVSAFLAESLQNALDYAKKNHVVIHSIGIGSETGPIGYLPEYYNISAVFNENTLLKLANETNGKYIHAFTNEDLDRAKIEIEKDASKAMIPIHLNYGLMLIALLALFLEWGLISTRYRRIP
ncbi:VWA domain-containing protein [Candidatus Woesearchaeota archaeon]|nr:VWA domain-containing protein [Candidatus Woesearchaeota archaeon]